MSVKTNPPKKRKINRYVLGLIVFRYTSFLQPLSSLEIVDHPQEYGHHYTP